MNRVRWAGGVQFSGTVRPIDIDSCEILERDE